MTKSFDKELLKRSDLIYIHIESSSNKIRSWQKTAKISDKRLTKNSLIYKQKLSKKLLKL